VDERAYGEDVPLPIQRNGRSMSARSDILQAKICSLIILYNAAVGDNITSGSDSIGVPGNLNLSGLPY
jgi:hypothetical protein